MPLTISVELLSGSYDAAGTADREHAEWPPHPARVFCALVAAARTDTDRAALRWLEAQPPPTVVAAAEAGESRRTAYVVVNATAAKPGSQTHPGRTNGLRTRSRALPTSPRVTLRWEHTPEAPTLAALDDMARRVPYLGRSTGISLVSAVTGTAGSEVGPGEDRVVFEPCDLLDGEVSVRVPYAGYLDQLDAQFAAGRPTWEVSRFRGYRRRSSEAAPAAGDGSGTPFRSMYSDVVVFRFTGLRPHATLTARLTEALRSAVLKSAGRDAPAVLHGHGVDGRPHVAFLALPNVGDPHSDGHLLGLAVAVPELPADERAAVLRSVLGLRRADTGGAIELRLPRVGQATITYQPGLVRPWGATPQRWRYASNRWASATPVVLDRFPKRPERIENEVLAGLRRVGLPEPVELLVSTRPLIRGAAQLRPRDLPAQARGRLFRHISVDFGRPVTGPLLVGAGRYLGVGLLAPVGNPHG